MPDIGTEASEQMESTISHAAWNHSPPDCLGVKPKSAFHWLHGI